MDVNCQFEWTYHQVLSYCYGQRMTDYVNTQANDFPSSGDLCEFSTLPATSRFFGLNNFLNLLYRRWQRLSIDVKNHWVQFMIHRLAGHHRHSCLQFCLNWSQKCKLIYDHFKFINLQQKMYRNSIDILKFKCDLSMVCGLLYSSNFAYQCHFGCFNNIQIKIDWSENLNWC